MTFSENINARLSALGLTYEDVWRAMSRRSYSGGVTGPSLSAVGNWFNGQRRTAGLPVSGSCLPAEG